MFAKLHIASFMIGNAGTLILCYFQDDDGGYAAADNMTDLDLSTEVCLSYP